MFTWKSLPSLPDREGFAGSFAGTSGGALIVAGGANFRDRKPWEGGTKSWYDSVFVLTTPNASWQRAGALPRPTAYGVSVTTSQGIVCAGGGNVDRHFTDVYRLQLNAGHIEFAALPDLPRPCAFMCGALAGSTFYLAGGIEKPADTHCLRNCWSLDLNHAADGWRELEPCPGPERMLAVAGANDRSFYLFSGARLSAGPDGKPVREYLHDAWCYTPGRGWQRLADLPRPAVAAPSPAPATTDGHLVIVSGDDGAHVGFKPEEKHPGMPRSILVYDTKADRWSTVADGPLSRATAPVAAWASGFVIASGEVRPGYRTPEVWSLTLSSAP